MRSIFSFFLWTLVGTVAATAAGAAGSTARSGVLGCWLAENGDSVLEVRADGDGLIGRVVALEEPFYEAGEKPGWEGKPRLDDRNPDPERRKQPVLGLDILQGFQFDENWNGRIYDPRSGDTYKSTLKVVDEGRLELRGYLGFSWLGRSVFYVPAASRKADRDRLFTISKTTGPCARE